jgi:hypothetical protein
MTCIDAYLNRPSLATRRTPSKAACSKVTGTALAPTSLFPVRTTTIPVVSPPECLARTLSVVLRMSAQARASVALNVASLTADLTAVMSVRLAMTPPRIPSAPSASANTSASPRSNTSAASSLCSRFEADTWTYWYWLVIDAVQQSTDR